MDFGCGSKPYEKSFSDSKNYIGLDYANDDVPRHFRKADYFYDGVHIPFPNSEFDMVVSFEVFEHVQNLDEVLREIYRTIKPRGYLCATTPFLFPMHENPHDYQRFTKWKWKNLLESLDFEVLEINEKPSSFASLVQLNLIYIFSILNPKNNIFVELLLCPVTFSMNLIGLIAESLDRAENYFPLTLEIIARKR
jgi:SAM-dependent methyltransferase